MYENGLKRTIYFSKQQVPPVENLGIKKKCEELVTELNSVSNGTRTKMYVVMLLLDLAKQVCSRQREGAGKLCTSHYNRCRSPITRKNERSG